MTDIEVTQDPEIPVHLVLIHLCDLCLDGVGGQCHVPGCALWIKSAPDLSIRDLVTVITPGDPESADALSAILGAVSDAATVPEAEAATPTT